MKSHSRILIVDDEPRLCDSLKFLLENQGYKVDTAPDGRQALSLADHKEFDLFLLDINLSEMNGLELMERFINKVPDAPVVLMTGSASLESAITALKKGAHDYFRKPIELEELLNTLKNSLEQKRLREENRAIAEKLKISEERYRFMVQNCPDIVYTLDREGKFIFVNTAIKRLLGHEPEKLLNRPWTSVVHDSDVEKAQWFSYGRGNDNPPRSTPEIRFKLADNPREYKYFEIRQFTADPAPPLFETMSARGKNNAAQTYGVARDISYRRQLETRLFQSDKMNAIHTLAGGIAHDFNNLLMGIQGHISLMFLDTNPDHPHHEKLKNMEAYVQSAASLTKQLLEFSRDSEYEVRPANLNTIVKKSSRMFARTRKELHIHATCRDDIWTVEINSGQIGQVLLNLYLNAWQAMSGSGDLYIQTQNCFLDKNHTQCVTLKPGKYVRLSVADNGCGMDEDTTQRIFEPFFTTRRKERGTGLGLASTYGIIKNHGGLITVSSTLGQGTKFDIYLPASEKKQVFVPEIENNIIKGSETVLLVDDEPCLRSDAAYKSRG